MSDNAEKALTASAGRTANTLYAHMLMNIVGICVVLQGRPALVLANSAGNTAAMAQSLANMSAGVGILEFSSTPRPASSPIRTAGACSSWPRRSSTSS